MMNTPRILPLSLSLDGFQFCIGGAKQREGQELVGFGQTFRVKLVVGEAFLAVVEDRFVEPVVRCGDTLVPHEQIGVGALHLGKNGLLRVRDVTRVGLSWRRPPW